MRHFLIPFLFVMCCSPATSQIGMLDWRVHFSISSAIGIAHDQSGVYLASANGVVHYRTDDNSIELITYANGLSDLGISCLEGNGETMLIGYSNGNLDVIQGNTIRNVPWIKMADLAGNKTIYSASFKDDLIYISTGIGLVLYDINKNEIRDTYYPFSNPCIYASTIHQDTLYCATAEGIYYAGVNAPFLNNQDNWTKKTDLPAAVINGPFTEINSFGDHLVFVYKSSLFDQDTLYNYSNGTLSHYGNTGITVSDVKAEGENLLLTLYNSIQVLDTNMNQTELIYQYNAGVPLPMSVIRFNNFYWIADRRHGLVKLTNNWSNEIIYNNGPYRDGCYRLDIQYGKVLIAGGGLTHNFVNNYFRNGVYVFEDEAWQNLNYETQDSIYYDKDWDFVSVAIDPSNTDIMAFCGNAEGGVKYISDGQNISEVFNQYNSTLEANGDKIAVGDIKFDDDGNLWMVCTGIEPLKVRMKNGEWHSFSLGSAAKDKYPYRLFIDSDGNKWVAVTNAGLIAFNENGTFSDHSDDDLRVFSTSEGYGNLPSLMVKSIAQDLDGEIWIGTEEGMSVLYNTANIYDGGYGDYDFNPILIEVDGEVEKLLGESFISAIAVDGGNRKWIATNSAGVFCLSPDGLEEIYIFNTDNSPLVSNNVLDIRIDHLSGEVFFATDKGLVSFRSDASIFDEEYSDVSVFPNPVRPDFSGPITVQGLGYEADVKITDVAGNLVYQTTSNGGTVIWDGKTLTGERVQTGVYLVWTASRDGKGKNVAKILFIN